MIMINACISPKEGSCFPILNIYWVYKCTMLGKRKDGNSLLAVFSQLPLLGCNIKDPDC